MEKISIIVPVYNVEKFIRQSLESIINQTHKNLEIILVDDGSTDSSGKICDEYSKADKRIKVIHQKNGGLSVARNTGLNSATGKYIMFIDSDDIYENNSCEVLYNEIERTEADYVIGNYIHITYDGKKWEKPQFDPSIYNNFKLDIKDFAKSFFVMNSTVCNKIFSRDFIEKHNLRFVPNVHAEDAIFSTYCYVHAKKAYYIKDVMYQYRQNQQNVSISTNCTKEYFERLNKSYKLIFSNFSTTHNEAFYRFFYARIMPYLLCKLIDSNSLSDEEILETIKMFTWFFMQKKEFNVAVVEKRLEDIVDSINNGEFATSLTKIKETKLYRSNLSDVDKEKMYAPNKELYEKMMGE